MKSQSALVSPSIMKILVLIPLGRLPKLLEDAGCSKLYNAGNVTYNDRGEHCKLEG